MTDSKPSKVAFMTLGCKVNQADTDALTGAFLDRGFEVVDFNDRADVYIVNTCTVTNLADKKSRQMLRRAIRSNPDAVVVAAGCLAETDARSLAEQIPELRVIVGTRGRLDLVEAVNRELLLRTESQRLPVDLSQNQNSWVFEEFLTPSHSEHTRATLKVQEGCQEFCSYCKIPYARGPVRSRPMESVDRELLRLAEAGFKEVVLAGVHLGHYGRDFNYSITIADVMRHAAATDGIERVRLSSIDPTDVTDDIIGLVADNVKVCRHLHIPLQGGTDDILKRMNRKYSTSDYSSLIGRIRQACPEVAISTDVIAGFPGESAEEFHRVQQFVADMRFSRIHVFPYSPRTGTPAATMAGQVPSSIKEERVRSLIDIGSQAAREYHSQMIGQEYKILIENISSSVNGHDVAGFTDTYVKVSCKAPCDAIFGTGDFIRVHITTFDSSGVSGEMLEDNQF